ncbi:hypothetical protein SNE40_022564 [Patella caerulea]|uniref:Uncharacterized protein n=1 Tax=Patella caerulea TaxID=87958 RepID=A0AAN8G0Y9_PATCE
MKTRKSRLKPRLMARLKKIKKLIKYTPHRINDPNDPPLIKEAARCNTECVKALLYAGADVNLMFCDDSAMARCLKARAVSSKDKLKCVKLLLRFGANLYVEQCDDGMTPLMIAAYRGETECLEEILKVGYLNGLTPSQYATSKSPGSNHNGLTSRSVRKFPNDFEPLIAVQNFRVYEEIYRIQYDPFEEYYRRINFAHAYMYFETVNRPLPDDHGDESLLDEEFYSDDESLSDEDFYSDDESLSDESFFRLRTVLPSYDEYKEEYKKDVDFKDDDGFMASWYCLEKRKSPAKMIACLKLLHDAGSDFYLKTGDNNVINHALKVNSSVFKYLTTTLGYKMDLNDDLLRAVGLLNISTVDFMINEGASLTMVHPLSGTTPLHMVILGQHKDRTLLRDDRHHNMKEMIRYLIQNNANVSSLLDGKYSALDLSFLKLDEFSFAREYLLSENISLGRTSYRSLKSCYEYCNEANAFQGKTKLDLLKFLHTCGLSTKSCLTFKEDEDPGSAVNDWLDKMASSAQSLLTICKQRVRGLLGRDIKKKVPGLDIPIHCQDLLLLKDVLSLECFE